MNIYKRIIKPALDIFLAFISLLVLSPLFMFVVILIKIDSPGPVFFMQERLGQGQKRFKLYKFRSMTHKNRKEHKQIFEDDPEVTLIGKYIRRFKIDELPQLINVIKGEMSIVGPRPCLPSIKNKFDENTSYRFKAKPGLTSLAAIKGSIYLSWSEKWYYDKLYVSNITFIMDSKIILYTLLVIFVGEKKFTKDKDKEHGNKGL